MERLTVNIEKICNASSPNSMKVNIELEVNCATYPIGVDISKSVSEKVKSILSELETERR